MRICNVAHFFFLSAAFALPSGLQIELGSAEILDLGKNCLSVHADDRAVLSWGDFSIGADESVHFALPASSSWVLNRVPLGNPKSLIDGALSSNGQIILINPNGVLIGKSGAIHAESLIASTLDLQNEVFLSVDQWAFDGASEAEVSHLGSLEVQKNASLIGKTLDISGPILSSGGHMSLVSASSVTLASDGALRKSGPWKEGSFVRLSSLLRDPGGSIALLGQTIFADAGTSIDVSSPRGLGTIAVGGGDSFFPAEQTVVSSQAVFSAKATESGDGGTIYVWSDKRTVFAGFAEATGGILAGNGGNIEVSGGWVDFRGKVDTRAPFGKTGQFLLDPLDIEIVAGAVDTNVTVLAGPIYVPNASPSSVSQTTLNMALGTSNVTVQSLGGAGPDQGNIILVTDYPIIPVPLSTNTLTLEAFNDILINASLSYLGPNSGPLVLNAPSGNVLIGNAPTPTPQTTNAIVRTSSNTVTITGRNVAVRGNSAGPYFAQVSSTNSTTTVTATAGLVAVVASNGNGAFAQIGADTFAPGGFMDINVSASQTVLVRGSPAMDSFAIIGHGQSPVIKPETNIGNIFVTAGTDVLVTGGLSATQNSFAIIGHLGGSAGFSVDCIGDVTVRAGGVVTLQGGTNSSYARIGHGSLFFNNATMTGSVDVSAVGAVSLISGTSNSMSHIGHFSLGGGASVGATTLTSALVRVHSDTSITLTPNVSGSASIIGGRTNGGGAASSTNITSLIITTPGNLTINPSIDSVGLIGISAGAGNAANGSIDIDIGGDLIINNIGGIAGDAITNRAFLGGASNPAGTVAIDARNIIVSSNMSPAAIVSSGPLTVNVLQDIRLTGTAPTSSIVVTGVNGTDIDAGRDIIISSQTATASGTTGIGGGSLVPMNLSGRVHAGRDIILLDTSGAAANFSSYIASTGSGRFDVIAGRDMILSNRALAAAVDQLNLVVDDNFPTPPLIGPGSFQLASGAVVRVSAIENLRIFTARQNQNIISGTLISGGVPANFSPGTLYANIPPELWGVYFYDPFFYIGQVFTIFYKDSLQQALAQATMIVDEMLSDLHPFDEFPGWLEEFTLQDETGVLEKHMLRRRQIGLLNQPKSWTVWMR